MDGRRLTVEVKPAEVLAVLLMVVGALIALHLGVLKVAYGGERLLEPSDEGYLFFDADHEISLPTWWQQSVLLGAAALALLLAAEAGVRGAQDRRAWRALAFILLFVSVDEGTQIHERLTESVRGALDVEGGLLYYAWVLPAAGLLVLFVTGFARFWWRMPTHPRAAIAAAGASYVLGGLVVEALGGAHEADHGKDWGYTVLAALEEGLEMLGQALLVYALLVLLGVRSNARPLTVGTAPAADQVDVAS